MNNEEKTKIKIPDLEEKLKTTQEEGATTEEVATPEKTKILKIEDVVKLDREARQAAKLPGEKPESALGKTVLLAIDAGDTEINHKYLGYLLAEGHLSLEEYIFLSNRIIARIESEKKILQKISLTDALTETYNYRGVTQQFNEKMVEIERYFEKGVRSISLLMIDMDSLKNLNETYDYPSANKAIIEVANSCKNCVRTGDVVGRVGGDEFYVILMGATPEKTLEIAENIRREIEQKTIMSLPSKNKPEPERMPVTVSIGVKSVTEEELKSYHQKINELYKKGRGESPLTVEEIREGINLQNKAIENQIKEIKNEIKKFEATKEERPLTMFEIEAYAKLQKNWAELEAQQTINLTKLAREDFSEKDKQSAVEALIKNERKEFIEKLISDTNAPLKAAKKTGKNQVVVAA